MMMTEWNWRNLWISFLLLFILSFEIFSRIEIKPEDLFEIVTKWRRDESHIYILTSLFKKSIRSKN